MNIRMIPRTAVTTSLGLARLPLDAAIATLPGRKRGAGASARVALDRTDATVRAVAGALLGDRQLSEDARRRHAAADERAKAIRLRGQADRTVAKADAALEQRRGQAQRRTRRADATAQNRRQQATRQRQRAERRAAETEANRRRANARAASSTEERIEEQAQEERLDALQAQEQALQEREQALTEADEARRLEEAAERAKAERKEETP